MSKTKNYLTHRYSSLKLVHKKDIRGITLSIWKDRKTKAFSLAIGTIVIYTGTEEDIKKRWNEIIHKNRLILEYLNEN